MAVIYQIINKVNNKAYIGSTKDIERRKRDHFNSLIRNKHTNTHLQYAYNKYGKDAFVFEILEHVDDDSVLKIEQQYLDIIKCMPWFYYNKTYIAGGGSHTIWDDARRAKQAELTRHIMNNLSPEIKLKLKNLHTGNQYWKKRKTHSYPKGVDGKKNPMYDHIVYSFKHKKSNEIIKCTKHEMREKVGYCIYNLFVKNTRSKYAKGWYLV